MIFIFFINNETYFMLQTCICNRKKNDFPQIFTPNSQNLWILSRMAKDVIKLGLLRGGAYPGLSRWALNAIICILSRVTPREIEYRHTEEQVMWRQSQRMEPRSLEITGAARRGSPLQPTEGALRCQHLDFTLLLSRTVGERISVKPPALW